MRYGDPDARVVKRSVHAVFDVAVVLAWRAGAIAAVRQLLMPAIGGTSFERAALSSLVFAVLVLPLVAGAQWDRATWVNHVTAGIRAVTAGVLTFVVAVWIASDEPSQMIRSSTSGSIFVAAFVEEVVYRATLPRRLAGSVSRLTADPRLATLSAVLIAQVAFAFAHFGILRMGLVPMSSLQDLVRLVAAGVMYWCVYRRCGLWLATGVHAALNYQLVMSSTPLTRPDVLETTGLFVVACWLLWLDVQDRTSR
jgi:membrane protease YdiL (CAAX protease family)